MKPNGQKNSTPPQKNSKPPPTDTPERAYARGFRECYGILTTVVNELPTDVRLKYVDKLQELFEKVRDAEKRAGEGL
jgi:hypothetical protein